MTKLITKRYYLSLNVTSTLQKIYDQHIVKQLLYKKLITNKGIILDKLFVAKEAIQEASRNGSDVVLVDTAGCMQVTIVAIVIFKSLMIL